MKNTELLMSRRSKGFTVVELLVVVSIIVLLVALFLPALKQAELRSKEAVCGASMRTLGQVWISYATDYYGLYPDMSYKPDGTGSLRANYWSHAEWRDYFETEWKIDRSLWYSPTNPRWNRDGFYYGGDSSESAGVPSGYWVMGRHCFTSSVMNTTSFFNGMQNTTYITAEDIPTSNDHQIGARRMNQKAYFDIMWTDLCREWSSATPTPNNVANPNYQFLTPGDANRWGTNHMYPSRGNGGSLVPYGIHLIALDGSLRWKLWDEIRCRAVYQSVEFWW